MQKTVSTLTFKGLLHLDYIFCYLENSFYVFYFAMTKDFFYPKNKFNLKTHKTINCLQLFDMKTKHNKIGKFYDTDKSWMFCCFCKHKNRKTDLLKFKNIRLIHKILFRRSKILHGFRFTFNINPKLNYIFNRNIVYRLSQSNGHFSNYALHLYQCHVRAMVVGMTWIIMLE